MVLVVGVECTKKPEPSATDGEGPSQQDGCSKCLAKALVVMQGQEGGGNLLRGKISHPTLLPIPRALFLENRSHLHISAVHVLQTSCSWPMMTAKREPEGC